MATGTAILDPSAPLAAADGAPQAPAGVAPAPAKRAPREITPEVRKLVGLPAPSAAPYPWPSAVIVALVFGVPLVVAGHAGLAALLAVVALVVLPGHRQLERRALLANEALYRDGEEVVARVAYVEPAGERRNDHRTRVEYVAAGRPWATVIVGAPLARRGLRPGEDVVAIVDPGRPSRCLLVDRVARAPHVRATRDHDHEHGGGACDGAGGCGKGGGCGGGGCGGCDGGGCGKGGGCGGGGCGGGGCGGGGCGGGCG